MNREMLHFDRKEVERLRKLYKLAKEHDVESFLYNDKEILTSYAKYMLEYLDSQFKITRR